MPAKFQASRSGPPRFGAFLSRKAPNLRPAPMTQLEALSTTRRSLTATRGLTRSCKLDLMTCTKNKNYEGKRSSLKKMSDAQASDQTQLSSFMRALTVSEEAPPSEPLLLTSLSDMAVPGLERIIHIHRHCCPSSTTCRPLTASLCCTNCTACSCTRRTSTSSSDTPLPSLWRVTLI